MGYDDLNDEWRDTDQAEIQAQQRAIDEENAAEEKNSHIMRYNETGRVRSGEGGRVITELFFCDDCLSGHFSGDFSGLEYFLTPEKAEAREAHIRECLKPYSMALLEVGEEIPFMASDCDCCGEWHGGRRHLIKEYHRKEPKNG